MSRIERLAMMCSCMMAGNGKISWTVELYFAKVCLLFLRLETRKGSAQMIKLILQKKLIKLKARWLTGSNFKPLALSPSFFLYR